MGKKHGRRLSLRKETLRRLDRDQLAGVAGGALARTGRCVDTGTCTETNNCATEENCATIGCDTNFCAPTGGCPKL